MPGTLAIEFDAQGVDLGAARFQMMACFCQCGSLAATRIENTHFFTADVEGRQDAGQSDFIRGEISVLDEVARQALKN